MKNDFDIKQGIMDKEAEINEYERQYKLLSDEIPRHEVYKESLMKEIHKAMSFIEALKWVLKG